VHGLCAEPAPRRKLASVCPQMSGQVNRGTGSCDQQNKWATAVFGHPEFAPPWKTFHSTCLSASKSCATGCSPSIQLEGRLRTFKEGSAKEEYSHEGLVSYRSAVRSRDLRNDPDLSASNAAWCRTERRWGEGLHLRARPSSSTAGGETRVPSRAPCCPSRLLLILVRTPTPLQRNRRAFGLQPEGLL
jgi:hypothetical protein